jgi:hypothetical protein
MKIMLELWIILRITETTLDDQGFQTAGYSRMYVAIASTYELATWTIDRTHIGFLVALAFQFVYNDPRTLGLWPFPLKSSTLTSINL